jgi:hypothetical protein
MGWPDRPLAHLVTPSLCLVPTFMEKLMPGPHDRPPLARPMLGPAGGISPAPSSSGNGQHSRHRGAGSAYTSLAHVPCRALGNGHARRDLAMAPLLCQAAA